MELHSDAFFQALSDPTRLRCLMLMEWEKELCVCELTHVLDAPQPKVSRHLAQLREAGIVRDRRQGLWVHYSINPALPAWARSVLAETAAGVAEESPFAEDRAALADMPNRPVRCCA